MDERLKKQMKFALEMDKEKGIGRQTYILNALRKENDAEHGWHLAIMTMLLSEYANEKIDIGRTIEMVVIHDVVEIDAGDTYAYDDAGNSTKAEREKKAADRIFGMLSPEQGQYFMDLWLEFEEASTPEAKFATAIDSVQPLMLNDASNGLAWREHEVAASKVRDRALKKIKPGSEKLYEMVIEIIGENVQKGNLRDC
ncbi:MAG: HD domain-containing protein [Lachnospiraceae bacterium]|nr:HD domain-containing protein [Lachnospiraceae bacterium]MBQ2982063.1 HD domain-containing protein [Lachnospiraceae bacterium]